MPNICLDRCRRLSDCWKGPLASQLSATLGREHVRDLLREITDELREEVAKDQWAPETSSQSLSTKLSAGSSRGQPCAQPSLRRVVNATGVMIHTNLGRAPLAREAIEAVSEVAAHYSNLEYDLTRGERGQRETHCQELLARLAGSEAAVVANNNAAAVLLC